MHNAEIKIGFILFKFTKMAEAHMKRKFRDAIIKIRAQKRPKTFSRCDAKNAYFVTKEATRLQRLCLMKN